MGEEVLEKIAEEKPWKVGDWCFFEHKLCIVKEVDPSGRVTCVSDGWFSTGCNDLRDVMFPLDIKGKRISEIYHSKYDALHKTTSGYAVNLNFPDIHRWFIKEWAECMRNRADDEFVEKKYNRLSEFVQEINNLIQKIYTGDDVIMGVSCLRKAR